MLIGGMHNVTHSSLWSQLKNVPGMLVETGPMNLWTMAILNNSIWLYTKPWKGCFKNELKYQDRGKKCKHLKHCINLTLSSSISAGSHNLKTELSLLSFGDSDAVHGNDAEALSESLKGPSSLNRVKEDEGASVCLCCKQLTW